MSELTDTVRKMLSQAQIFVRDTPFEAVSRVKQALRLVDDALATVPSEQRPALEALRRITVSRLEKYEATLALWRAGVQHRADEYTGHERAKVLLPLRDKS